MLFLVLVVAAAVRMWGLTERTITHIEIYVPGIPLPEGLSIPEPRFTLRAILTGLLGYQEPHPPGYYVFMLGWTKLLGSSLLALRLPSVLFGVGSVFLLFMYGVRLRNRPAALLAAGALTLNGHHILWSQLAKGYIVACFLGLLSTLLLLKLLEAKSSSVRLQVFYAGVILAGFSISHWFWALFAAHILWTLRTQWRAQALPGLVRLQLAIFTFGSPFISLAVFQSRRESYLSNDVLRGLIEFLQFGYLFEPDYVSPTPPLALLVSLAAVPLLMAGIRSRKKTERAVGGNTGPRWALTAVGAVLVSLLIRRMALFMSGYDRVAATPVMVSSALPLLLAAGVLLLERHWSWVGAAITSVTRATPISRMFRLLDSESIFFAVVPVGMTAVVSLVIPLFASRGVMLFTPYLVFLLASGLIVLLRHSKYWLALAVVVALVHPASVLHYRNGQHEGTAMNYKQLAEQWMPQIQESDLIFVERHWATTPIFYYLDAKKYHFWASDYTEAVEQNPDARLWVLFFQDLPLPAEMEAALTAYEGRTTVGNSFTWATLYERVQSP